MALAVTAYAFGTDSGTEATHPLGTTNAALSRSKTDAGTFLLRFLVQATGAGQNNIDFQLMRRLDGGAFANVTTTSTGVKAVATAVFVDQANTTSRLGGTGTFETTSSGCSETGLCGGAAFDIITDGRGETLYAIQLVPADLTNVSTITFKMQADAVDFTHSVTPTINLTDPNFTALPSAGIIAVAGSVPTVSATASIAAAAGTVSIAGQTPSFAAGAAVDPSVGVVALRGYAPDVTTAGGGLTERLTPSAILASTNLRDTLSNVPPTRLADIDDDTGGSPGPDDEWWTAVNEEADIALRLGFPTSSGTLIGTQTINVLIRGTALPCRDVKVQLYENGSPAPGSPDIQVTQAVSSIDGQVITLTFQPGDISDQTGAGVEILITATAA